MKIAYITVKIPYGEGETFIIPEIKEVLKQGHEVVIMPFRPSDSIFHKDAESLRDITHHAKIFAFKVLVGFFLEFLIQPLKSSAIIAKVLFNSRNFKIALKNLTTIPKGFYASRIFRKHKVEHIHAHWASTPSSVAYIASYLTGIQWSFTAHRWDIAEDNILKEKVQSALFARTINEKGKDEMINIIDDSNLENKVVVIHMGVNVPRADFSQRKNGKEFTLVCPANLLPVKGHRYLIESCRLVADAGINFKCFFAGDGPLENNLKSLVSSLGLESYIEFLGRVPHESLLAIYKNGETDLVVLPSIVTEDGEKEGIPVALMEAMAYGIPVVSTNTGGIPELIDDNCGVLVKDKDSKELFNAIADVLPNKDKTAERIQNAYLKIRTEFDIEQNTSLLVEKIKSNG